jgi:hypothetical protein
VIALDPRGGHEVVATVASIPMCIDFLPDGRLLVVDSAQRRLLRRESDGSLVQPADLSGVSEKPWNDIVAARSALKRAALGHWPPPAGLDEDELDQPGYQPQSGWRPARGTGVADDYPFAERKAAS